MLSSYRLTRVPQEVDLQAWNAADELFLHRDSASCPKKILILNEPFGALSIALSDSDLHWWNDSAMAEEALVLNCQQNNQTLPTILDKIPSEPTFGCIVLHLPKSLNFFAWQLEQIHQCLLPEGKVFVLGMVKHISKGHIDLMSRFFRSIHPGRAVKKARVIYMDNAIAHYESKNHQYVVKPLATEFENLPGCFAENTVDPGALVFIDYLQHLSGFKKILDLGCGNGILSYVLLKNSKNIDLTLVDESRQALASAKRNLSVICDDHHVHYLHANGTNKLGPENRYDLIVCNPPFHQGFTLTETIAKKLFSDAKKHLSNEGEFWVVANRHLRYFPLLKKRFASVVLKSNHPKFNVYCCRHS